MTLDHFPAPRSVAARALVLKLGLDPARLARAFRLVGNTAVSFSGGRTSAFMLWLTLHFNTPEDIARYLQAQFANTGLEAEETLRFVLACELHFGMPITWVEYRFDDVGFAVVDFDSASRNGEPFEAIVRKRQYLPNPITRFCTVELTIRAMHKRLRSLGWADKDADGNVDGWDQLVGIRADEPSRVAKIRARGTSTESSHEEMRIPLADGGVTVAHVGAFWDAMPFNLELPTYGGRTLAGNCVLCFLKPRTQVQSLIQEDPKRAVWWARMETEVSKQFDSIKGPQPVYVWVYDAEKDDEVKVPLLSADGVTPVMAPPDKSGATFRNDRPSYSQMLAFATAQDDLFGHAAAPTRPGPLRGEDGRLLPSVLPEEPMPACFCGD